MGREGGARATAMPPSVRPLQPPIRLALLLLGLASEACAQVETGIVSTGTSTFAASYLGDYIEPVIIAGIPSHNGDEEIVVRITSFDAETKTMQFYADVPQHHADSTDSSAACSATFHASEEFAWILLEAANPQQHPQYQAGTVPTSNNRHQVLLTWLDITFAAPIANPVCLSQIQSHNGGQFCKTRQQNPSSTGFQVTVEEDNTDNNHNPEVLGWAAFASGSGTLGALRYQAINTPMAVTHELYEVDFASGGFTVPPAVFGSIATMQGGDPSALRRTSTTASSVQIFVEEETCTDDEQEHVAEQVSVLVMDATYQVDSQLQATLPASLGRLTAPFVTEGDYITIPNVVGPLQAGDRPNGRCCDEIGEAQFQFSCAAAVTELTLAFEINVPTANDDSVFIGLDDGAHAQWDLPHANHDGGVGTAHGCVAQHCEDTGGFHWATYTETFDPSPGKHTLHIYGREDGVKIRKIRFVHAPGCHWTPKLPPSLPSIPAAFGKLTAPMQMHDDFIWVPETFTADLSVAGEGGCIDGRENRYELTAGAYAANSHCSAQAQYAFFCRNDATVAFDYEIMAPDGHDDSFYISIDDGDVFLWSTPQSQDFTWAARPDTTDVEGGLHTLIVHGREDGTKLRSIRFSQGGCGFIPQANRLPSVVPAASARMTGSFVVSDDFVWTPPVAMTQGEGDGRYGSTGQHCTIAHPQTENAAWAQLTVPEQQGAAALGWEQNGWDCDFAPSHTVLAHNEECNIPSSEDKYWTDLTAAEAAGATALGWSQESWDCGISSLAFAFACSEDAEVTFSFESFHQEAQGVVWDGTQYSAPDADDSFFLEVDAGTWDEFHVPVTSDWTVHDDVPRSVPAGTHTLWVHSRSAGTKLRTAHIDDDRHKGVCGWTAVVPPALRLPDTLPASHGKVVAPMEVAQRGKMSPIGESLEYVWAPDSAVERACTMETGQWTPQGATCGRIEMKFYCDTVSEVSFSYEVLTPSGNDDSFFIQVDASNAETWHAHTTATSSQAQCAAIGGLGREYGGVCCASSCGVCAGGDAGDLACSSLPGGADACCGSNIANAGVECGTPPCWMAEPFEWHTPRVNADGVTLETCNDPACMSNPLRVYHVNPGLHTLILHQREDGAKVRNVRFEHRGSCGFAVEAQLPEAMPAAFAKVEAPVVIQEGTENDQFFAWVPPIENDPGVTGDCATYHWLDECDNDDRCSAITPGNDCGGITFAFSCATESEIGFEYEVRAPSTDDNSFYLQLDGGTIRPWTIPVTADQHRACVENGGLVNGDVCCDAACGSCGGNGCGQRPGGGELCCVGAITRANVMCSDNGGVPPCLIDDPWEWRRYLLRIAFFV
jgi:hypothetical protein